MNKKILADTTYKILSLYQRSSCYNQRSLNWGLLLKNVHAIFAWQSNRVASLLVQFTLLFSLFV